jgi:hypothetical protein
MNRGRMKYGLFAVAILAVLQGGACLEAYELFFGPAEDLSSYLESASVEAVAKGDSAYEHANRALETKDINEADLAVADRPMDPYYRYLQATLALASGDDERWFESLGRARGLEKAAGKLDQSSFAYRDVLVTTINHYPDGTDERARLVTEYCAILDGLGGNPDTTLC